MSPHRRMQIAGTSCALLLLGAWSVARSANPDEETWREECGSCHIAYPARFLPARSWKLLMSMLEDHFATDASVDAATADAISRYLASAASSTSRTQSDRPGLRITETRWFVHEHDDISQTQWSNPKVKSASNCGACHQGAETGHFSEDSVHIPK